MNSPLQQLAIQRQVGKKPAPKRKWIWPLLAAVLLGCGIAWMQATKPKPIQTAKVTLAWPSAALSSLTATGYVVAQKKAAIASKATGRLEWLGVREGSPVVAGQLIARLENAEQEAQVAQAIANMEAAKARLKQSEADALEAERALRRSNELLAQGFISSATHDNAVSRAKQAQASVGAQSAVIRQTEAALKQARVALDSTLIRAPFAGVVLTKNANVGDVISPFNASADSKGAVVTMADMDTLEVEADVSEASLFKAKQGQPCEIQLDALPDLRLLGRVNSIVPSVDRAKATVTFKVGFVEHDVRVLPEMSAKVSFLSRQLAQPERSPRLAINPRTVQNGAVFVVRDGTAHRVDVKLGDKLGDLVEVRQGLKLDEVLVLEPTGLKDGAKVQETKA
ncbi:efflux RND transporter periplasmic adaptor subunit [Chitinimonas sp. PSY-7]|uniref:efflux RND transporter periplasmic adaptor subunit n=1 Tax=Chitinimonas sp. PSY-7 TaxID=3459088 RepID=UPI00404033F2